MGYTHYWERSSKMRAQAWGKALAEVNLLTRANTIPIVVEEVNILICDREDLTATELQQQTTRPKRTRYAALEEFQKAYNAWQNKCEGLAKKVKYHALHINGAGDGEYETFVIPFRVSRLNKADYCKTARKPYDRLVVASLCVLAEAGLIVTSDGGPGEWRDGQAWAESVLGRKVKIPDRIQCSRCGNTGKLNRQDLKQYPWYGKIGDPCTECHPAEKVAA